ncbi:hypothetical protein GURKE_00190 [Brevundimonas phage vB_BpoS-Gurke]|uniref:Uncharacterized protein n=1 Tax=Brevundimonas phage vB_BpoS-Gurke TaxID=2948599 RepID=A0A9E7N4I3_9CAUD|nr:hypothetical protein GURKE_00190 [Brevundimonas phage vB_BpoS-Gurke]
MTDKITKRQAEAAIDNLRTLVETLWMQIGPANRDRSLENLTTIERYINKDWRKTP